MHVFAHFGRLSDKVASRAVAAVSVSIRLQMTHQNAKFRIEQTSHTPSGIKLRLRVLRSVDGLDVPLSSSLGMINSIRP
eukprot:13863549-Alexandrium_andersonii.AAC.1